MKTAGTVLSVAGTIALIVVAAKINSEDYYYLHSEEDDIALALTSIAGVSAVGAGIPLWIVGGYNQNKYEQKLKNVSVGMRITSQSKGLALTYRF